MPRGIEHHSFKNGRYSMDLPSRLAAKYLEAEADPELLSARSEVALLHVRIREIVARLHTGESGSLWALLNEHWDEAQAAKAQAAAARQANDPEKQAAALEAMGKSFERIGQIIKAGKQEELVWDELVDAIDAKTRIAGREHARLRDLQQMLSTQEALTLISAVVATVREVVADPKQRIEISNRLSLLLNVQPATQNLAGPPKVFESPAPAAVIEQSPAAAGGASNQDQPTDLSGKEAN